MEVGDYMETIEIAKKDEIVMKLVHYFVTEENYVPIIVNGVKNEVWLENSEGPYKIIRINSNYIHNNEQLNYDIFKTKNVIKQIRSKTLSLKMNSLNILLDVRKDVKLSDQKNVSVVKISSEKDLNNNKLLNNLFPEMKDKILKVKDDKIDFLFSVSHDINEKTTKENKVYEDTFKPKKVRLTYILMAISIIAYVLSVFGRISESVDLNTMFGLHRSYVLGKGQWYRLITAGFLHVDVLHLFFNMYSLNILGSQLEQFLGKRKLAIIYFLSAVMASMFSITLNNTWSIGASGAIFGLFGSIIYFGYHYRLYFGQALRNQLIPVLFMNLLLGFMIPNIDVAAHLGGLFAGVLLTMAVGIDGKTKKRDHINGIVCYLLLVIFLLYLLLK